MDTDSYTANRQERYRKLVFILGVVQIMVGGLTVLVGVLQADFVTKPFPGSDYHRVFFAGEAFWGGAFFVGAGVVGVLAGRQRRDCMLTSFMVMSVIGVAVMAPTMLIFSILTLASSCDDNWSGDRNCSEAMLMTTDMLVALISIYFAVGLFSTAFSSCAVCTICCHGSRRVARRQPYAYVQPGYAAPQPGVAYMTPPQQINIALYHTPLPMPPTYAQAQVEMPPPPAYHTLSNKLDEGHATRSPSAPFHTDV